MLFCFCYLEMGAHTHVRLFAGATEFALSKAGDFALRNEEWKALREELENISSTNAQFDFKNEEDDHSTLIPR